MRKIGCLIVVLGCAMAAVWMMYTPLDERIWVNARIADWSLGSIRDWPKFTVNGRRDEDSMRAAIWESLGPAAPECAQPVSFHVKKREVMEYYERVTISYNSCGDDVPAILLQPVGPGPFPAVVAMHQSSRDAKFEVIGVSGDRELAYGHELALRGFVVIAPDMITTGERITGSGLWNTRDFYQRNPKWSALGRMLADHKAAIDVLQSLPNVNRDRIGAIGHSLGGHNALFLAAFDPRVKAVVANCGYERMETDSYKERWSRETDELYIYTPHLRPYVAPGSTKLVPWDFQHLLLLIEPRPIFQSFALADQGWTQPRTPAQVGEYVEKYYETPLLTTVLFAGDHRFPREVRQQSYEFLEGFLKKPTHTAS